MVAIGNTLASNMGITDLNLFDNKLGDEGTKTLAEFVRFHMGLTSLSVAKVLVAGSVSDVRRSLTLLSLLSPEWNWRGWGHGTRRPLPPVSRD